jgi:hypothetical protein
MRHHVTELCVGASALARHPAAYDLANDREPVFAAGYWAELGRVVRREGASVERVFAEHLPATAWGDRAR